MKTKNRILKWMLMLVLAMGASGVWAQTSQTTTQTACVGNQPYKVDQITGATFVWSITGGVPADYQINNQGSDAITVDWNTPGEYVLSVYSYIAISCPSSTQSVTVTIVPQPTGPTLNAKTPALASVCDGTDVSATFLAGSGGVGCSDAYQYRFDGSGLWTPYTPGNNLATTGHSLVEIQGQRVGCTTGTGCSGTAWETLASWTVNPNLPVSVSIATTDPTTVCEGVTIGFTASVTNGGTTPTYQWYNGASIITGATSSTYTYTGVVSGASITCVVTSNATCATGSPATSNAISVAVNPIPTTSPIFHN